ncbi:MAG TPA: 4Fe-4S dicluster domain-containing protein [bacterium (Candidatus Stahlbacteria)]|nr:4Fe-4S dicluster domain-containing protein [Candidatus Stahlbacteria bacterium]
MSNEKGQYVVVSKLDPTFKYEVAHQPGGEHIKRCFQCGTCTAGCPVREIDDKYNPRKIIRMTLLGMRDRVLSSEFIWLCSTCYTCHERCPQDVRITEVMNVLKNMAVKEGYIHPAFKEQARLIGTFGRLYEVEDFDNKKRERLGLPKVEKTFDEVVEIFKITGLDKLIKEA